MDVPILQGMLTLPTTSEGLRSLLSFSRQPGSAQSVVTGIDGGKVPIILRSEVTSLYHKQMGYLPNTVAAMPFQSLSGVMYTGHSVGGARRASTDFCLQGPTPNQFNLGYSSVRPNSSPGGFVPNFVTSPNLHQQRCYPLGGIADVTNIDPRRKLIDKAKLYESNIMHGSHFLCDLMGSERLDSGTYFMGDSVGNTRLIADVSDVITLSETDEIDETMHFLMPEIDMKVSDGIVRLSPEEADDHSEKQMMVKLEKYYYCSNCKNNCFFTPNLLNHFKYCSTYISTNSKYNDLKKKAKARQRPKARPQTQKLLQIFFINGAMVKCDKRLLAEDIKLREKPFVKMDNLYQCPSCDRKFVVGSKELSFHLKRRMPCAKKEKKPKSQGRPKKVIYDCEICEIKFKKEEEFTLHVQSQHNGVVKYKCKFCKVVFPDLNPKLEHIAFNHLAVVPSYLRFKCKQCHRRFNCVDEKELHEREHIGDELKFKCTACSKEFRNVAALRQHLLKTHGRPFEIGCSECGETFPKQFKYFLHLQRAHKKGMKSWTPNVPVKDSKSSKKTEVLINTIPEPEESICKSVGMAVPIVAKDTPTLQEKDLPLNEQKPLPVVPVRVALPPTKPRKSTSKRQVEVLIDAIPNDFEHMDIIRKVSRRSRTSPKKAIEVIDID